MAGSSPALTLGPDCSHPGPLSQLSITMSRFRSRQFLAEKSSRVARRKVVDPAEEPKPTRLVEFLCSGVECIDVEADTFSRTGFCLGTSQQEATDTLPPPAFIDPQLADVGPAPMGNSVQPGNEHVAVIGMNREG